MKVTIRSNRYPFFPAYEEKEMTRQEILHLRQEIRKDILSWFKWEDYPKEGRHIVISAELKTLDSVYIYREGLLMTDEEFYHNVADKAIFVDAIHKHD